MGHYLSTLTNRKWKKAPMRGPFYLYLSYDWQVPIPWQLLRMWPSLQPPGSVCYYMNLLVKCKRSFGMQSLNYGDVGPMIKTLTRAW